MQNKFRINGRIVSLGNSDVIGQGGEGIVFRHNSQAVKIYRQPSDMRAQKLKYLLSRNWSSLSREKVILPTEVVEDLNGNIVGLTMPLLGHGYEEISSLSNKRYRRTNRINPEKIVRLFIDGAQTLSSIHSQGIVVGDLNDRNELFRSLDMIYLEPDGMQVDRFPCLVATEQFVAPELYGVNFANQRNGLVFEDNFDWYSFAVMLFKSLLLTHPYGGVYKALPRLTQRAQKRITVFHPDVVYPKIAEDPSILSNEMKDVFDEYFQKGWRGPFPLVILENYLSQIAGRPVTRPAYHVRLTETVAKDGIVAREVINVDGSILYSKVIGEIFYVIAQEEDYIYLYSYSLREGNNKRVIFRSSEAKGAKYEIFDSYLAINVPSLDRQKVLIFEISDDGLSHVATTGSEEFSITQRPMFRASGSHFYRLAGSTLMEGTLQYDSLVERTVRTVNQKQTWFVVNPNHIGASPQMFGFFQVLADQLYWYSHEGRHYDVKLASLEVGEVLRDISVRFSSQGAMIRRKTTKNGVDNLRIELIDEQGKVIFANSQKYDDYKYSMHGLAYTTGKALHATDEGIVQEDILAGKVKVFGNTKPYLAQGYVLEKFAGNLAVVTDNQVIVLEIK